jgi:hypothetical protein
VHCQICEDDGTLPDSAEDSDGGAGVDAAELLKLKKTFHLPQIGGHEALFAFFSNIGGSTNKNLFSDIKTVNTDLPWPALICTLRGGHSSNSKATEAVHIFRTSMRRIARRIRPHVLVEVQRVFATVNRDQLQNPDDLLGCVNAAAFTRALNSDPAVAPLLHKTSVLKLLTSIETKTHGGENENENGGEMTAVVTWEEVLAVLVTSSHPMLCQSIPDLDLDEYVTHQYQLTQTQGDIVDAAMVLGMARCLRGRAEMAMDITAEAARSPSASAVSAHASAGEWLHSAAEAIATALAVASGRSETSVRGSMLLDVQAHTNQLLPLTQQQYPLPLIACPLLMDRADIFLIDGGKQLMMRVAQAQESALEWLGTSAGVRCTGQR